jgi:hypothetical protein
MIGCGVIGSIPSTGLPALEEVHYVGKAEAALVSWGATIRQGASVGVSSHCGRADAQEEGNFPEPEFRVKKTVNKALPGFGKGRALAPERLGLLRSGGKGKRHLKPCVNRRHKLLKALR